MTKPIIGIVIPCFGHTQFLAEAVISACEQDIDAALKVVVVDDGCKFEETFQVVDSLKAKYPGILHYLRQENSRLPGARNTGIRFLLSLAPDIDSIYFLDADNRLASYSLKVFREALGDDPVVGWAYPDINMFGYMQRDEGFDVKETAPVYSPIKHLIGNISEAGSLVRADVFRAGVFYDESMKSGFEDWDFWLSALGAGFVGERAANTGFMYRRRPESMLADSRRLEDTLIEKIRQKHRGLFNPKYLMQLEHAEAPVFAVLLVDEKKLLLTSDPKTTPREVALEDFAALVERWFIDDREDFMPDFLVVTTKAEWKVLQKKDHSSRWLFWRLKEAQHAAAFVYNRHSPENMSIATLDDLDVTNSAFSPPVLMAVCFKAIRGMLFNKKDGAVSLELPEVAKVCHCDIVAKDPVEGTFEARETLFKDQVANFINQVDVHRRYVRHARKFYSGPSAAGVQKVLMQPLCAVDGRAPFPANSNVFRVSCLAPVPIFRQVPMRRSFARLVRQLHDLSCETLLFLEKKQGERLSGLPLRALEQVSDIIPVSLNQSQFERRQYLGKTIENKLGSREREDIAVLTRTSDIILCFGVGAGLEALGQAKTPFSRTVVWLVGIPVDDSTRSKLLAYEHAIGQIVCDDDQVRLLLAAGGFPPAKFVTPREFWKQLKQA